MTASPSLPPFAAVVVAAGRGERAGLGQPKQLAPWRGKPVVAHSVARLLEAGAQPLVVAVPAGLEERVLEACGDPAGVIAVEGGATRQQSVARALDAVAPFAPETVLIHDAARPDLPQAVIARLRAALLAHEGAIPVLPIVDSLVVADGERMGESASREALRRVQTPQAFRYAAIRAAFAAWEGPPTAGDDAQVLAAAGGTVALVPGDEALRKLTFAEDFMTAPPPVRIGTGFDVHRLVAGEELWLGGIQIPHAKGLAGHSDADVALHALVDALLGAVGDGDIGTHFPPSEARWRGARSDQFLRHAAERVMAAGYTIGNVDLTLICEEPRIGPHRPAMRARIAELLGVDASQVSVKATTTEGLGFTGRGEGIAAQAAATVVRSETP